MDRGVLERSHSLQTYVGRVARVSGVSGGSVKLLYNNSFSFFLDSVIIVTRVGVASVIFSLMSLSDRRKTFL